MEMRYDLSKVEKILEKREHEKEGSSKEAILTLLNGVIDELERDLLNKDLQEGEYHITEFEIFTNDLKKEGLNIPDEVMERYDQVRKAYLNLI